MFLVESIVFRCDTFQRGAKFLVTKYVLKVNVMVPTEYIKIICFYRVCLPIISCFSRIKCVVIITIICTPVLLNSDNGYWFVKKYNNRIYKCIYNRK